MRTVLGLGLLLAACSTNAPSQGPSDPGPATGGSGGVGSGPQVAPNGLPVDFVSAECRAAGSQPGASPIRRLTRHEYDNTVLDLLGDTSAPAKAFTDEEVGLGFTNNANVQTVSDLLAEQYETAAIALAKAALASDRTAFLGCDPNLAGQDVCARSFIVSFGGRAYRRALDAEETERLFQFYSKSAVAYGFETGVRMTVEAMLQSPHFLYRVEPTALDGKVQRVTGYAAAARLSYLLWSSMPDAALLAAASTGTLDTAVGVTEQAERMLTDPKINRAVGKFFSEWLELDTLGRVSRDATLFPTFNAGIKQLLRTETERFTTDVVFSGAGDLKALLLGNYTFMNKTLADFYGVTGPQGEAFERVELDTTKRVGLLTQGSLLAAHANTNQTSPVARGFFVRARFLCSPPPPPPPTLNVTPPEFNPNVSTRERYALHRKDPVCSSCHQLMDPVGLGFENFDAVGRYRDEEAGKPIDASGEFFGTDDIDGPFNGAVEMAGKLATSAMTRSCMVKQWFRYGYGRGESDMDKCTLDALGRAFTASDGNVRDLLLRMTQTDAFLYRTNETGAMP